MIHHNESSHRQNQRKQDGTLWTSIRSKASNYEQRLLLTKEKATYTKEIDDFGCMYYNESITPLNVDYINDLYHELEENLVTGKLPKNDDRPPPSLAAARKKSEVEIGVMYWQQS